MHRCRGRRSVWAFGPHLELAAAQSLSEGAREEENPSSTRPGLASCLDLFVRQAPSYFFLFLLPRTGREPGGRVPDVYFWRDKRWSMQQLRGTPAEYVGAVEKKCG